MKYTCNLNEEGLLDEKTVGDFINMFFGDDSDANFELNIADNGSSSPQPADDKIRGSYSISPGKDTIWIWVKNLRKHSALGYACGGNDTLPRNARHAIYLTLAHELRHARQARTHGKRSVFYNGKYAGRASEVDARRFVDENYDAICAFVDVEPKRPTAELNANKAARHLVNNNPVTINEDCIWDWAFSLPGDPDKNFLDIQEALTDYGCPEAP